MAPAIRPLLLALLLQWLPPISVALRMKEGLESIPRVNVNLDLPPRERWKHIVPHYRDWYISITPIRQRVLQLFDPAIIAALIRAAHIDEELMEEIRGIHEAINYTEATLEMALIGHMKYELGLTERECSGIVAAMENGTMVHGRNMDLGPSNDWAKDGMMHTTFWRGGTPLFQTVGIFSLVGGGDGVRVGSWSMQQNTRHFPESSRGELAEKSVQAVERGAQLYTFVLRRQLQDTASFDDVVESVRHTTFAAPGYWMIAGAKPFQGAVITVRRQNVADGLHAEHDVVLLSPGAGPWFLVQTNDDWWHPDTQDPRRQFAMSAMGSRVKTSEDRAELQQHVWSTMRSFPLCSGATWYSWVSVPALERFEVTPDRCPG